jgi:hypothetical protein
MRTKILVIVGVVLIGAAATSITLAARSSTTADKAALSRLSNAQRAPITLPANDVRTDRLLASGFGRIWLVASRGDTNFLELEMSSGRSCYGTGQAGGAWPIGVITCRDKAPFFPSPEMPILDESIAAMENGESVMHFTRIEGFAADGVARVGLRNAKGLTVTEVPVINNVYSLHTMPSEPVTSIVALDSTGKVLASRP